MPTCPVCGAPDQTCGSKTGPHGPGVTLKVATFSTGVQVAEERIYRPRPDNPDILELVYIPGDRISKDDADALGIVDGRVVTKQRRAVEDKARRTVEDKGA